ncbi:branched-chain amino acid ABC transporter permease [Nocardioides sp. LHD-245]|uniref:branched-chain amino acid ABC transporter permease n=1 Tax=Nocardioides sp. LHD-245 TaxID=3051387 RepID=UPI0027E1481F|nr:branched-chain amino acid ABC transporter permease [Nocardioides sp. LHD-245]
MVEVLVDTAVRGSIIALLAVGLTLIQGTLRFANVAHVEFATLGGYSAVALTGAGLGLLLSSALGVALVAVLAVVLYRLLFRRLLRSGPMIALIGSLALAIVIRATLQLLYGSRPRYLPTPLERGIDFHGALITPSQIRLVCISLGLLALLALVLKFTSLGRAVRAVAANPELADVSGLNRGRVVDIVWMLSAGLAAVSGILLSIDSAVGIELGFNLLLPVFAAAIVGGLGSIAGAVIAAYALACAESLVLQIDWGAIVGGTHHLEVGYRPAVGFALLVVMLAFRPQGLMGRAVRRG